jgi:hypothetical protein
LIGFYFVATVENKNEKQFEQVSGIPWCISRTTPASTAMKTIGCSQP